MNKNKGDAGNIAELINLEHQLTMNNNKLYQNKLQHNSRLPERKAFVCDECARPLRLYGENFIETYTNGKANILRCLCDLHADEMEVNA